MSDKDRRLPAVAVDFEDETPEPQLPPVRPATQPPRTQADLDRQAVGRVLLSMAALQVEFAEQKVIMLEMNARQERMEIGLAQLLAFVAPPAIASE